MRDGEVNIKWMQQGSLQPHTTTSAWSAEAKTSRPLIKLLSAVNGAGRCPERVDTAREAAFLHNTTFSALDKKGWGSYERPAASRVNFVMLKKKTKTTQRTDALFLFLG